MLWDDLREVDMIKFSSDGFQDPKLEQILVIFPFNDKQGLHLELGISKNRKGDEKSKQACIKLHQWGHAGASLALLENTHLQILRQ